MNVRMNRPFASAYEAHDGHKPILAFFSDSSKGSIWSGAVLLAAGMLANLDYSISLGH